MAKIVKISGIHPTLGFTEFDILEKYHKSFKESEPGRLHSVFPFECMAKAAGLSDRRLGHRNIFSPSAKIALMVLKAYTGFTDRQLVEHLNGTTLPDFLWNHDSPVPSYNQLQDSQCYP